MAKDLIYGTAWKEDLTENCVLTALKLGYRAIDSANQRKHYNEEGVGEALKKVRSELGIERKDLFLQSKFTYPRSQDHRLPYDPDASPAEQVRQSMESSLKKLGTEYLDSYLLHGPSSPEGLTDTDLEVWNTMEDLCRAGKARSIGIANVTREQISELFEVAHIKPATVQNRCLAMHHWDRDVRTFCREKGIQYQGFSLLTNNWKYIGGTVLRPETRTVPQLVFQAESAAGNSLHPAVQRILDQTGQEIQKVILRFAQQLGVTPLFGTRSEENMRMNLNLGSFSLKQSQIDVLENIAFLDPALQDR